MNPNIQLNIEEASPEQSFLRLGMCGPSGSGKTFTALSIAAGIVEAGGADEIVVIDSENGSATKYAKKKDGSEDRRRDRFRFKCIKLPSYSIETYMEAITLSSRSVRRPVLIIDSLSHAWAGKDGALEAVDKLKDRERGNSFAAWRFITPLQQRMVEMILSYPGHVIATLRVRTEYVIEKNERGKDVPRKVGLAPIQRDGLEYEFDVFGDLNDRHDFTITKTRCDLVDGAVIEKPGRDLGAQLASWCGGATVRQAPRLQVEQAARLEVHQVPRQEMRPIAHPEGSEPRSPIGVRLMAEIDAANSGRVFDTIKLDLEGAHESGDIATTEYDALLEHWRATRKARAIAAKRAKGSGEASEPMKLALESRPGASEPEALAS